MSKKLVSLVLVLALTSMASAVQWDGPGYTDTAGAWETAANWYGDVLPAATDTNAVLHNGLTGTSYNPGGNITVSTAVAGSIKPQMKYTNIRLTINDGGSMTASGTFEQTAGTLSEVNVLAGGLLDVCTKTIVTTGTYKMASSGTSVDTLNIYGTVQVKNQGTLTTAGSNITVGGAAGGTATVNIYAGGLLDVDIYSIGSAGDKIKIWSGGLMKVKGYAMNQALADLAASKIVGQDFTAYAGYDSLHDVTLIGVPEPATVALLGLGSLLFYRKKH